ncbi:MAG: protein translocase SEC61 complex subunit gamma [Candidatus Altiarchaeota archaeon]|nr:protein translocase SEC61 complex subunit gamma [Candidatus Altiarchaeota archaeon]
MGIQQKIVNAYKETKRILRLTRKPRRLEFNKTAKITGLGMIAIGVVGFIIFAIAQILPMLFGAK